MEDDKRIIVIGDVHGCWHTLCNLLAILPRVTTILVGDMVDRGKYSKQVVNVALATPYISSVKGNHEQMLVDTAEAGKFDKYGWLSHNGGWETILSYDDGTGMCEIPDDHYDFLKGLPLTISVDNVMVSHSHVEMHQTLTEARKSKDILWNRGAVKPVRGKYHVFGHTPNREPIITDRYANVNTGCVFGGKLTAIELPSKKIYQVEQAEEDKNRWSGVKF